MGIEVPKLNYQEIKKYADRFLENYNPKGAIPVPIDQIVEFDLGMNIIPIPNIKNLLDTDGGTSYENSTIYVDENIFINYENRYRFTLAHEVGHLVLHEHVFRESKTESTEDIKKFIRSIPEDIHSEMEFQAYDFAGLTLVPTPHLKLAILELTSILKGRGIVKHSTRTLEYGSKLVGKKFKVSSEAIQKRIRREPSLRRLFE